MSAIMERKEKTPLCRHMKQGVRKRCKRYGKYKKKRTSILCINENTLESTRGLEWKRRMWYVVCKLV